VRARLWASVHTPALTKGPNFSHAKERLLFGRLLVAVWRMADTRVLRPTVTSARG